MLDKMIKLRNKKGFTLMEMLIVVAIIAILVAIAIPTFNANLNKARVATDAANIRAGYALVAADIISKDINTDTTYYLLANNTVTSTNPSSGAYTTSSTLDSGMDKIVIGSTEFTAWSSGKTVSYTYVASTGAITPVVAS